MEKQYLVTLDFDASVATKNISFTIEAETKTDAFSIALDMISDDLCDKLTNMTCKLIAIDGIRINEGR